MIDINIEPGIRLQKEIYVSGKDMASTYGSGLVDVFATPAMIALLEATAMESIEPYLPEGYTSVGSEVNIKHLKATAEGKKVIAESYLKSFDGRKALFELHAWDDIGMIGIGTHTRVVVEVKEFMGKLN